MFYALKLNNASKVSKRTLRVSSRNKKCRYSMIEDGVEIFYYWDGSRDTGEDMIIYSAHHKGDTFSWSE